MESLIFEIHLPKKLIVDCPPGQRACPVIEVEGSQKHCQVLVDCKIESACIVVLGKDLQNY
jgi:hypothetical protein